MTTDLISRSKLKSYFRMQYIDETQFCKRHEYNFQHSQSNLDNCCRLHLLDLTSLQYKILVIAILSCNTADKFCKKKIPMVFLAFAIKRCSFCFHSVTFVLIQGHNFEMLILHVIYEFVQSTLCLEAFAIKWSNSC